MVSLSVLFCQCGPIWRRTLANLALRYSDDNGTTSHQDRTLSPHLHDDEPHTNQPPCYSHHPVEKPYHLIRFRRGPSSCDQRPLQERASIHHGHRKQAQCQEESMPSCRPCRQLSCDGIARCGCIDPCGEEQSYRVENGTT